MKKKTEPHWRVGLRVFCGLFTLVHILIYIGLGCTKIYDYTVDYIDRTSLHPYEYIIQPGDGLDSISNMVKDEKNGYSFKDAQNIYGNGHAIYHGALKAYDKMTVYTTKSRAAELNLKPAEE